MILLPNSGLASRSGEISSRSTSSRRSASFELADRRVRGAVDRLAPQPEPAGGLDLVAHQRQQRRDQQRRPEPLLAQQVGGQEVDGALAPPRALHHEHPRPIVDERLDRLALPVAELGVGAPGQPPESVEQVGRVPPCGPSWRVGVSELSVAFGSGAGSAGDADRIGAARRATGPPCPVPSGAFLCEALDAHLDRARLGTARQPGTMALRLVSNRSGSIALCRVGPLSRRCDGAFGEPRGDADRLGTLAPPARFALRMGLCLRVGLALRLLQTSTLTKRRAHLAVAHLADPTS